MRTDLIRADGRADCNEALECAERAQIELKDALTMMTSASSLLTPGYDERLKAVGVLTALAEMVARLEYLKLDIESCGLEEVRYWNESEKN